jgi:hypothetical protein
VNLAPLTNWHVMRGAATYGCPGGENKLRLSNLNAPTRDEANSNKSIFLEKKKKKKKKVTQRRSDMYVSAS